MVTSVVPTQVSAQWLFETLYTKKLTSQYLKVTSTTNVTIADMDMLLLTSVSSREAFSYRHS